MYIVIMSFDADRSFQMTGPMMEVLLERNHYSQIRLQALRKYHKYLMEKLEDFGIL